MQSARPVDFNLPVHPARLKRSRTLDLCRGMLFACMANTHALTLVGVPQSHWLFTDAWLPNGWATVVFVVLSGYGVGYIFSVRPKTVDRNRALLHRSLVILGVMFVSNAFFAALRLVMQGDAAPVLTLAWWLGFITLETPWTISGVLLPTAVVILCAPFLMPWIRRNPWSVLTALVVMRLGVAMLALGLGASPSQNTWWVRFFLLEGFGGFPVLPFVLNGCLGLWIGMRRHCNASLWGNLMLLLLLFQLIAYVSHFAPTGVGWTFWRNTFGPLGKFAWVFVLASIVVKTPLRKVVAPLGLIGKYALTSFVIHRFFLQIINGLFIALGLVVLPQELRYAVLWISTLLMTWGVCHYQERKHAKEKIRLGMPAPLTVSDQYLTR